MAKNDYADSGLIDTSVGGSAAVNNVMEAAFKGADVVNAEAVAEEVDEVEGVEPKKAEEAEPAPDLEYELGLARAEVEDWKDKHLRLQAEWNTYRRRMAEQREQEKAVATAKLVESLLPVVDDFERTVAYAEEHGSENLLGGVQAVHAKLMDVLTKDGVEVVDPQGEAFDALEHQAVGTVEDDSVPDETVAQVYQKGYKMGGKVLRPAMVTVTTGGPKRPKDEKED